MEIQRENIASELGIFYKFHLLSRRSAEPYTLAGRRVFCAGPWLPPPRDGSPEIFYCEADGKPVQTCARRQRTGMAAAGTVLYSSAPSR